MNKKILIPSIILAVIVGGFFYWWLSQPIETEEPEEKSQPPSLFAKEDYKTEEREDGKYIVVEKVGLTCKVPEGWSIKYQKTADIEPQYWVDAYSSDFATTTNNILAKGCIISTMVATAEKTAEEIEENIKLLQESPGEYEKLKEDYTLAKSFEIIEIDDYRALKIISQENKIVGQIINVDIAIRDKNWINFSVGFPLDYKGKCSQIWEEFLKNIVIE